jgi:hypothetical protein
MSKPTLALFAGAVLVSACAAYSPGAQLARVAPALDIPTDGDGCPYDGPTLARVRLETWKHAPHERPLAPEMACVALRDDLVRDSRVDCTPDVRTVLRGSLSSTMRVTGEIAYVGVDPREYAYDLRPGARGGYELEVRVQLTGDLARNPAEVDAMQRKMDRAADFWTEHSPGERVRFRFVAVTSDASLPHFQVELVPGEPRVPYDVSWGREWSWHLLAHEIGHMMGLDDEYGQLRKTMGHALGEEKDWKENLALKTWWFQCNVDSLMCDSKGEQSAPLPYHYYVILRRPFCEAKAYRFPQDW